YYHRDANGTESVGTTLKLTLEYDTSGLVFIEGIKDVGEIDDLPLAKVLAVMHPNKGQWGFDKKQAEGVVGWDPDDMSSASVKVKVELSGGTSAPIPQN